MVRSQTAAPSSLKPCMCIPRPQWVLHVSLNLPLTLGAPALRLVQEIHAQGPGNSPVRALSYSQL